MTSMGFSIGDVLKFGWEQWKKNWATLMGITLFAFLIPMIPHGLLGILPEESIIARFALALSDLILAVLMEMGLLTIALKVAKEESFGFSDFFSSFHHFISYFFGKILFSLSILLGLFVFIIPGIIIAVKFNLWPFFVLDRSSKAIESLKKSNQATLGVKWDLFLFGMATLIINFLGILVFGIGILITLPITLIAWAKIYLTLKGSYENAP